LKRVEEIALRDCRILNFSLTWGDFVSQQIRHAKLTLGFASPKGEKLLLIISKLESIDFYENEVTSYHIGHIKCLIDENEVIWLCLDPYDEHIMFIEEKDNFKFSFKSYELVID
jgi:hypothetical protein